MAFEKKKGGERPKATTSAEDRINDFVFKLDKDSGKLEPISGQRAKN